jgi:hypothetical protein
MQIITVAEFREVDVCGNDGIIVDRARGNVFLSSFGPQVPLHRTILSLPPARSQDCVVGDTGGACMHDMGVRGASRPVVLLVQMFAVGYYHWLLDVLPRALVRALQPISSFTTSWNRNTR